MANSTVTPPSSSNTASDMTSLMPGVTLMSNQSEEDWQFDEFNDGVMKSVRTVEKEKLQTFVNRYLERLRGFTQTLETSADQYWTSNCSRLVSATFDNEESTHVGQLVLNACKRTDLNKVFLVFSSLCAEIKFLKKMACDKFYPMLLMYGEDCVNEIPSEHDCKYHEKITAFLPEIINLSRFIARCQLVYKNFMCQLAATYFGGKKKQPFQGIYLTSLMDHLALLLGILLRLDEIISFNQILRDHWGMYKRMIKSIIQSPSMFDTNLDEVMPLEKWLVEFEAEIFDQMILQNCVTQNIDNSGTLFLNNKALKECFMVSLQYMMAETETTAIKNNEFATRSSVTSLVLLFVLNYHLFREFDVKFNKRLWDIMKRTAVVNLIGPIVWYAPEFVLSNVPPSGKNVDRKVLAAVDTTRQSAIKDAPSVISKHLHFASIAVAQWQLNFHAAFDSQNFSEKSLLNSLHSKMKLCSQGLSYARSVSGLIKTVLPLYSESGRQMSTKVALQVMRLVEMLKIIQLTINSFKYSFNKYLPLVLQNYQVNFLRQIHCLVDKLPKNKDPTCDAAVSVAVLKQAGKIVSGPINSTRLLSAGILLEYALHKVKSSLYENEISSTFDSLAQLSKGVNFQQNLNEACDCSFLQWGKACIPVYLSSMLSSRTKASNVINVFAPSNSGIPVIFAALKDIVVAMGKCDPFAKEMLSCFENEILSFLEDKLIEPLRLEIESDLRYSTHLHLKVKDCNPLKQGVVSNDFKSILALKPFRFMDRYINIAERISMHLTQVFYNLTAITPQDWQAYTAMKFCAEERYGIELMDSKLPQQTLEQGLDVLEIMRNIHVFVGQYLYNLNNQIFIEQTSSNNRHVNTINIHHIANSMRTHGTGIMNTTVNYTFQYLTKQFRIFSQFLFDEQIKGKLIKEIRFFREKREQLEQLYPYERAEKVNKSIRRLGLTKDNLSYLDEFRKLISQIGNAMGFVRMIRSGGINTCSRAIEFVPDLDDIVSFEEQVKAESLPQETVEAAKNLDTCLGNLSKNFAEGTDYFQLFVSVFSPEFRKAKNVHLKNFYVIVPALMINFVEYIKQAKEQMTKKSKTGALFTDDGFAMGVSFILALLDQNADFDSLHWFDSVNNKLKAELVETQERQKKLSSNTREDQKQLQTEDLTFRRINKYQEEFDLIFFSFSSARIFFQQPDPDEAEDDVI